MQKGGIHMEQNNIGQRIATCRKRKNLTQLQLAKKLGITDKAVSKWERDISMPGSALLLKLCDILEITADNLLCGKST